MATLLRRLSAVLFVSAIGALLTLLASDALNLLSSTLIHRQAGALTLMLIGASYLMLQFTSRRPWNERFKGALLGVGFLFWGSSQLLPTSSWTTAMDTAVVSIFVVDLSLSILETLRRKYE